MTAVSRALSSSGIASSLGAHGNIRGVTRKSRDGVGIFVLSIFTRSMVQRSSLFINMLIVVITSTTIMASDLDDDFDLRW